MKLRMGMALLSMAGLFVSAYLYLYKIGLIGTLACGNGGCETVQLSPQSKFLGVDVALIGLVGYAVLLGLSLLALQPRFAGSSWPVRALPVLSGGAVLFTAYLKYLELFVIHAICRWCVASAVMVTVFFVMSVLERKRLRTDPA
ncbi:MAG: vitamin K epoxide reductase family protein [Gemmatimonadota bacterium]